MSVLPLLFVLPIVCKKGMEMQQERRHLLVGFCISKENTACPQQKILNHHDAEDRDFFHTEEARCATNRVGLGNNR